MTATNHIKLKAPNEIKILRKAGRILSSIVKEVTRSLKSGMTTQQLDLIAEKLISDHDVIPAFKGYRGFPACCCISVNQEVVHGIPGDRVIRDGDIVSVDVGIIYQEYYSDTAVTVGVGKISSKLQELLDVTRQSLYEGIEQAHPGNRLGDISYAIQKYVEERSFSIVRDFVGHGIGRNLHEAPEIPNFGSPATGPVLKEGMVIAIEPMVNVGTWQTRICDDGWTVVTADGQPSAHFEHSLAITADGPLILTE
ncbi:MAG: type I methionyl aminopeptidase [Candidatus Omnitrophica bacterium]|nr:type I methionyl aminopeptidase [Candidatus Omnitrophota bacterium]